MKGIIIAAGKGARMGQLTENCPKCMLRFGRTSILEQNLRLMNYVGCDEVVVITGHAASALPDVGIRKVHNPEYEQNNVLHSLMMAREEFDDELLITYSDIWVEQEVYEGLLSTRGEVVLVADTDWRAYYVGRDQHTADEAEKIYFDEDRRVISIGKHLSETPLEKGLAVAEFPGLLKLSRDFAPKFAASFESLNARIERNAPFQKASRWQNAYLTDMLQQLIDDGFPLELAFIERGWAEFDTVQDLERVASIGEQQKLYSLSRYLDAT